jgi:hypothetical protein
MMGGIALLCVSAAWAFFWCAQLSTPFLVFDPGYQAVYILVASLALIPIFWATWLIDQAWRNPTEAAGRRERLIAVPTPNPHIEPKTESDSRFAGLMPDERNLVEAVLRDLPGASVAEVIAQVISTRPAEAPETADTFAEVGL